MRLRSLLLISLPFALLLGLNACSSTDPFKLEKIEQVESVETLYKQSVKDVKGKNLMAGVSEEYLVRQAARIDRTRTLIAEGKVETGEQCMYAAAILTSSGIPEDLAQARDLGFRADQLGEPRGLPIAAEAIDKLAVASGKPQKYGTQIIYIPVLDSFRLEPYDLMTTDEERATMGLPPFIELEARVERMNQLKEQQGI